MLSINKTKKNSIVVQIKVRGSRVAITNGQSRDTGNIWRKTQNERQAKKKQQNRKLE